MVKQAEVAKGPPRPRAARERQRSKPRRHNSSRPQARRVVFGGKGKLGLIGPEGRFSGLFADVGIVFADVQRVVCRFQHVFAPKVRAAAAVTRD